jgi:pimeloyl-ACP methyl ester carboxylesterase
MAQVQANGLTIEYDVTGPADGEPVLLIMGLGAQMTRWPQGFLDELASRGLQVIRFDNRDIGLTTKMDAAGMPDMPAIITAVMEGREPPVAYHLSDMAADAAGLLDALGLARAHIVGASLGGMVAQLVAADHSGRVLSLTSIMSTTGNRALPPPTAEAIAVLNNRGPSPLEDLEAYLDHALKGAIVVGSPGYRQDPADQRQRLRSDFERSYSPVGFARQYAAAMACPDRRPKLNTIAVPTVVIHGAADPLVPLAGGQDTAENIPGAELLVIEGMGHDVPPALFVQIADGIARAVNRARAAVA